MKYLLTFVITNIIVLQAFSHVHASSTIRYKKLNKSHYTILGLTIGECSREDILSKLGPSLSIKGEKKTDINHLCYISDRHETLIIFSFEENQCKRFRMISRKAQFYKWHFCAISPLISNEISTLSGIELGMQKNRLKEILGTPERDSGEILVFKYNQKTTTEIEEHKRGFRDPDDENIALPATVRIYIEAGFADSVLSSLHISVH